MATPRVEGEREAKRKKESLGEYSCGKKIAPTKMMVDQRMKKMPGWSWIEVRNKVIAFVARKHSNPYMNEQCNILHFIDFEMRNPCFVNTDN
ncbi:hypothetical protein CerSpe_215170 [Prunus speciosa]